MGLLPPYISLYLPTSRYISLHLATPRHISLHLAASPQVRVWASCRGQTLCRTAFGIAEYEAALALQAWLG